MAGRSVVTRRAILDIVKTAVQSSYGVTGFADESVRARLRRWFGIGTPGVALSTESGLTLDLYLTVAYGVPVAEVARQVDSAVRYAIRRATGAEIGCLSIHVDGMRYQPMPAIATPPATESDGAAGDEVGVAGKGAGGDERAAGDDRSAADEGASAELEMEAE